MLKGLVFRYGLLNDCRTLDAQQPLYKSPFILPIAEAKHFLYKAPFIPQT